MDWGIRYRASPGIPGHDIHDGQFHAPLDLSIQRSPGADWVLEGSRIAKSGVIQTCLVAFVLVWTVIETTCRYSSFVNIPETTKAVRFSLPHEILSQVSRGAAFTFTLLNGYHYHQYWCDALPVGLAFLLGLARLLAPPKWQRVSLHQINFLLFTSLVTLATAYLLPSLKMNSDETVEKTAVGAVQSLAFASLIALVTPREWAPPPAIENLAVHKHISDAQPTPEETSSWFVLYFSFGWLTPLIWKGWRTQLDMHDLPGLPWYDEPSLLLDRILKVRQRCKTTMWTVLSFQRSEILAMSFWIGFSFALDLVAPFAMYQILNYISAPDDAVLHPVIWLALLFVGPMGRSITTQQYVFTSTRLVVRLKSAMTQELYHRALASMELEDDVINDIATRGAKEQRMQSTSAGRLANLMASDIDAVFRARDAILGLVGVPVGIALSIIGLYKIVGWTSLVGLAFLVLSMPLPAWVSRMMAKTQRKAKLAQDSRISLISEYLEAIRAIKYFSWEDAIIERIQEARENEQKQLWHICLWYALLGQMGELIPVITLLLIFSLYVGVMKQPLTAPIAFTTLSVVMTLRRNMGHVSQMSRILTNAHVSMERLDKFYSNLAPLTQYPEGPLRIEKATFRRSKKAPFFLKDISIDFVEGGLNIITGQSGSGKTSLLLSILGETTLEEGTVTRPSDVAFASQTPWLQSETIRDNILFHAPFEQVRYDRVIEACCLGLDFEQLPKGDLTEVGENGNSLSLGQKSRVAVARALYSKAPLLLLDDIFSALDAKTSASLWKHSFCSDMLKGRTVILVTQMPWVASQADLAITMEAGTVKNIERNIGVVRTHVELEYGTTNDGESQENSTAALKVPLASDETRAGSPKIKDEISNEMSASGTSGRFTLLRYMLHTGGIGYVILAIGSNVISNAALLGTTWWLSVWVNAYNKKEAVNVAFYITIYAASNFGQAFLSGVSFLIFNRGAWLAARKLHRELIEGVLNVSLGWWKNIPVGRVVNRFSRDVGSLDSQLSSAVQSFIQEAIGILFKVGAVSSIMPIFMLPALLTVGIGIVCGEMYIRTAVVLKRLVSSSQSPVFSQFSGSMAGLAVIRARTNMPDTFRDQLAERLRSFSRSQETSFNLNRWIGVRIDFVAALVTVSAGAIAVWKVGVVEAGLVGFSLSNATGLSSQILRFVRYMNDLEVELQSFHRVEEYVKLPTEDEKDGLRQPDTYSESHEEPSLLEVPEDWPRTGAIEFRNVTVRYDPDGPDILKDISLKFKAGQRVAVVGRTGSGKSTLVLSLLRFTHIVSGQILYDGVDITRISRKRLRQALTIIPQEATLFNGTVRTNLDPSGTAPVQTLENALRSCAGIASFDFREASSHNSINEAETTDGNDTVPTERTPLVSSSSSSPPSGASPGSLSLDTSVQAKGENFSHGQRQVLSLCRALVRKSKLMLLDEATASMDYQTDRGIQVALRKELGNTEGEKTRTLVTIAHRLRTIVDYDLVVVIGGGRVVEVGSPEELYKAKGVFWEMVRFSGESEDLERVLEGMRV
ncbi:P-loop containing nucleoside triphosphate hydrolase protein [Copromyces sp. CBS 386.78]|nr:P-loop containing nucleoside triphosphate hydrolase protein [Copromyces sp. CBS 386.78]